MHCNCCKYNSTEMFSKAMFSYQGRHWKKFRPRWRSAALNWRCQWWGLQLTGAGCSWRGCQWPRAGGFHFQHKVILTIFQAVTCLTLSGRERFCSRRVFAGQKVEKFCQAEHPGQMGGRGLGRTGVSSAWRAVVWGNSSVGCGWAGSIFWWYSSHSTLWHNRFLLA